MAHVFGLESLRTVNIYNIDLINFPEMRNNHVRTLNFHASTDALKQYLRIFPKLTILNITVQSHLSPEAVLLIKNMDSLEELRYHKGPNPTCSCILWDIKLPNLRKFEIYSKNPVDGDITKEFIKRHPNVTDIKLDFSLKPGTSDLEIFETLRKYEKFEANQIENEVMFGFNC
jgi:hypothetical protein